MRNLESLPEPEEEALEEFKSEKAEKAPEFSADMRAVDEQGEAVEKEAEAKGYKVLKGKKGLIGSLLLSLPLFAVGCGGGQEAEKPSAPVPERPAATTGDQTSADLSARVKKMEEELAKLRKESETEKKRQTAFGPTPWWYQRTERAGQRQSSGQRQEHRTAPERRQNRQAEEERRREERAKERNMMKEFEKYIRSSTIAPTGEGDFVFDIGKKDVCFGVNADYLQEMFDICKEYDEKIESAIRKRGKFGSPGKITEGFRAEADRKLRAIIEKGEKMTLEQISKEEGLEEIRQKMEKRQEKTAGEPIE